MDSGKSPHRDFEKLDGVDLAEFPELDEEEILDLLEYASGLVDDCGGSAVELFEGEDEILTKVVSRVGYLEVHKRTPCVPECESCPHGPFVYHVRRELHPGGEVHLHWVLIGPEVVDGT